MNLLVKTSAMKSLEPSLAIVERAGSSVKRCVLDSPCLFSWVLASIQALNGGLVISIAELTLAVLTGNLDLSSCYILWDDSTRFPEEILEPSSMTIQAHN